METAEFKLTHNRIRNKRVGEPKSKELGKYIHPMEEGGHQDTGVEYNI